MSYTFQRYQQDAYRTAANAVDDKEMHLLLWSLALCGEAGEFGNKIKKIFGHGHKLDKDELADELGDVLWYISAIATLLDVDLSTIAIRNIEKLLRRYPDGFSQERSVNREV